MDTRTKSQKNQMNLYELLKNRAFLIRQ